jgi:hypothetical protein
MGVKNIDPWKKKPKCVICWNDADRAHIKSRGSGGCEEDWNLMHLCRWHHQRQHMAGWWLMSQEFEEVADELKVKGWGFDEWGKLTRTPKGES